MYCNSKVNLKKKIFSVEIPTEIQSKKTSRKINRMERSLQTGVCRERSIRFGGRLSPLAARAIGLYLPAPIHADIDRTNLAFGILGSSKNPRFRIFLHVRTRPPIRKFRIDSENGLKNSVEQWTVLYFGGFITIMIYRRLYVKTTRNLQIVIERSDQNLVFGLLQACTDQTKWSLTRLAKVRNRFRTPMLVIGSLWLM